MCFLLALEKQLRQMVGSYRQKWRKRFQISLSFWHVKLSFISGLPLCFILHAKSQFRHDLQNFSLNRITVGVGSYSGNYPKYSKLLLGFLIWQFQFKYSHSKKNPLGDSYQFLSRHISVTLNSHLHFCCLPVFLTHRAAKEVAFIESETTPSENVGILGINEISIDKNIRKDLPRKNKDIKIMCKYYKTFLFKSLSVSPIYLATRNIKQCGFVGRGVALGALRLKKSTKFYVTLCLLILDKDVNCQLQLKHHTCLPACCILSTILEDGYFN